MPLLTTSRQIGRTIKNAGRLRTIVGVFAKHGFHNIAERIQLGRFILERLNPAENIDQYSTAERIRMSFEELGPTFIKLGQLLASRPDLVPQDFVNEFSKLHDQVQPLPFETIEQVLKSEYGSQFQRNFLKIEQVHLGSASIAQVHKALLHDGTEVVIKIQKPGIVEKINDDLNVLYLLAELLEKYVPETRLFNPIGIVDEYFKTLELETNFIVEANNLRRFAENFSSDLYIRIPKVYLDLSTERVLVMEALQGTPLSNETSMHQEGIESEEIIRQGLRCYLKMVFIDGLFHGDLHAGNFFILPNNQIGLIDFGVVGRLNHKTQEAIASMLMALAKEDYERLAYDYIDLAPYSEKINVDLFAKDLRDLIAPYFGLTLKNINLGKLLLSTSSVAAKHKLSVPTELMLFFKSLVGIESLGKKIKPDFDFLTHALQFASELFVSQVKPQKILAEFTQFSRESRLLIKSFPRHLQQLLRKWNSPDHSTRIQILEFEEMKKTIEVSFNLLFLAVIIAALLLSASYIYVHEMEQQQEASLSVMGYSFAIAFGIIAFFNYIKKR